MNKKMKIAAVTVAIAAAGAGAYIAQETNAKYTTGGNGQDSARIAKWHIDPSEISISLFSQNYENGDGDVTVASKTTDAVIAPGTTGEKVIDFNDLDNYKLTEVAYAVKLADAKITNKFGARMTYALKVGTKPTIGNLNGEQLQDALDDVTLNFDASGNPTGAENNGTVKISWEWNFEGPYSSDDAYDTYLASDKSDNVDDGVKLDFTYSATQTD
ncbi:MAG: hypothetical protein LBT80_01420 [Lactobacillaceae bacterium]|jgi:hypothetical protein|nr:hypothetical protein [Lactobacillaceae bacterium]